MSEIIPRKPNAKAGPSRPPPSSSTSTSTSLPPVTSSNGSCESTTDKADKKENFRHSQAVAFGRNFFYALGGTLETTEQANAEGQENTNVNAGVLVSRQWEQPSWQGLKGGKTTTTTATATTTRRTTTATSTTYDDDESNDIRQVVCTVQSTVFLTVGGRVHQTGTLHGRVMPEAVPITIPLPLKCVQVAAGRHFCLGMMEGGLATVSWGAGHFGQLGLGANKKTEDGNLTFVPQPIVIERLLPHVIGSPMKQVACGDWHGLALTESGKVWAWGSNRSNQCGRKSAVKSGSNQAPTIVAPLPVPFDIPVSKIAAGRAHSVAITKEKAQVYCWGASAYGQCGHVLRRSGIAPPKLVEGLENLRIIDIAAGATHTLGLTSGGRLFSWGAGSEGQLGIGLTVGVQPKPKLVSDLDFVAIEAGQEWKNKKKKQAPGQSPFDASTTSDESSSGSSTSTSSSALSNVPRIVSVHCAGSYSAVICSSGHVYAFGSNDVGQAGLATPENVPIKDNYILAQPPKTSTIRDLHVSSFDSSHNVLLPVRVAAAKHLYVDYVACGPNHMWCVGKQRTVQQKALFVGRTLYEVQEEKRTRNLQRAKENLLQKASRRIAEEDSESEEDVSLVESLSQLSTVQENLSVAAGTEPPGSNLGTPETVRRIASPTLPIVSETTTPSMAEIAKDSAACLSPLHIKPKLSAFSSPNAARGDAKAGASERRAGLRRRFSLSNLIRRRKGKPAAENDNSAAPMAAAAANGRTKRTSKRNSL